MSKDTAGWDGIYQYVINPAPDFDSPSPLPIITGDMCNPGQILMIGPDSLKPIITKCGRNTALACSRVVPGCWHEKSSGMIPGERNCIGLTVKGYGHEEIEPGRKCCGRS